MVKLKNWNKTKIFHLQNIFKFKTTEIKNNNFGEMMIMSNIHETCENYNGKKDMCLKWFETDVSRLKECREKTEFNDNELQRKWSN